MAAPVRDLRRYVELGKPLVLCHGGRLSLADVQRLGAKETMAAMEIRSVLIGPSRPSPSSTTSVAPNKDQPAIKPDPRGAQIFGAWVQGELDLDGLATDNKVGLRLVGCKLDAPLKLRDAGLPWLELDTCVLPAVLADRAQLGVLKIRGCYFTGNGTRERVGLIGAHIAGDLVLTDTVIDSPSGLGLAADGEEPWAVQARGANVGGRLSLEGTTVEGTSAPAIAPPMDRPAGAVCLSSAVVGGDLVLRRARLVSGRGPALMADNLTVKGHAFGCERDDEAFEALGAGRLGAVCLTGAAITGRAAMSGSRVSNVGTTKTGDRGPAVTADLVVVQGGVFLDSGFTADGAVRFWGANITAELSLEGARITTTVPADPEEPMSAAAVCLTGAQLGRLVLRRATLFSEDGPALMADYLTVKGDAFLCEDTSEGFSATGAGKLGAVCLGGANITGQVSLQGAKLKNAGTADKCGPALLADAATIGGDVRLNAGFEAIGSPDRAAVSLVDASVGKQLWCTKQLRQPQPGGAEAAPAVVLSGSKVGTLFLDAADENVRGAHPRFLPDRSSGGCLWGLDGLTYTGMPNLSGESPAAYGAWVEVLRRDTAYAAQPYQALAAAYEGIGDDLSARRILMAQRDDALRRGRPHPLSMVFQLLLKAVIGYGYKSTRAIVWLVLLFALTALLAVFVFIPGRDIVLTSAVPVATTSSGKATPSGGSVPDQKCSDTSGISYTINLAFPIINLSNSTEQQCNVPPQNAKWWVVAFGWLVRAIAATLAGFYVAGLAGVTRTPPSG